MADVVSLLVALAFAVAVGADLSKLMQGDLTTNDVDLLNVLVWPVLVILGGGAASMFLPSLRQPRYGSGLDPYPPVMPSPPPAAATSQQPEDVQPQTGPPAEGGPSI
ncbi:MAG: hypothetical protein QJR07_22280 [Acetobacteraceae bacterium]|nr:hypothetical protein [Acetobacteraceae bacterium]